MEEQDHQGEDFQVGPDSCVTFGAGCQVVAEIDVSWMFDEEAPGEVCEEEIEIPEVVDIERITPPMRCMDGNSQNIATIDVPDVIPRMKVE